MDTPERNQINTPLSKFEDSPVYNFINNLSPIKPLQSAHTPQTFNSISFSSPPSVFTSPHVNCLKESRFLKRHNPQGTSKPRVSYEDVNRIYSSEEAIADSAHAHNNSTELQANAHQGISVGDASIIELSGEHTKFSVGLPQASNYNFGCPVYYPPPCGDEANSLLELPGEPASDVAYVPEGHKTNSIEGELHPEGMCPMEPKSEGQQCDWDSLIPDATDLLIFNSPYEAETFRPLMQKPMEYSVRFIDYMSLISQSMVNDGRGVDSAASLSHSEPIAAAPDRDHRQDNTSVALMTGNTNEKVDNKLVSLMRGARRRCLDFEMASVRRKNSDDNSNTGANTSLTDEKSVVNEKQLLPAKCNSNSQRRILPGIGLHLNAFGSTSLLQLSAIKDHHHQPLLSVSSERELDQSDNGAQPAEDCSQASGHMGGEDFNQNSPKKRRRKLEPAGETEGCKRCNCKKSKCLKLYCECFAAGVYCTEPCSCQDCFNKPIHEDTVLQTRKQIESRNPLAFAPKVIRSSDSAPEIGDDPNKTPAPARHKRGCNCKKSSCLKKYCECYQGGVGCSISCRCEGCKNAYGRKDGSAPLGIEAEPEDKTEACEKSTEEKALQKTEVQNIENHPDSAPVSTPLRLSRSLLPLPLSSEGQSPGSFVATISNGLYPSQKLGKPNSLWSQPMHVQTAAADDEMLDVLGGDNSPFAYIKTSSPNGKRVSSPVGPSPSRRGGRKLILRSIPSFPSLSHH